MGRGKGEGEQVSAHGYVQKLENWLIRRKQEWRMIVFLFLGSQTFGKMEGLCEGLAVTCVPHFPDSGALPAFLSVFFQPHRGKER